MCKSLFKNSTPIVWNDCESNSLFTNRFINDDFPTPPWNRRHHTCNPVRNYPQVDKQVNKCIQCNVRKSKMLHIQNEANYNAKHTCNHTKKNRLYTKTHKHSRSYLRNSAGPKKVRCATHSMDMYNRELKYSHCLKSQPSEAFFHLAWCFGSIDYPGWDWQTKCSISSRVRTATRHGHGILRWHIQTDSNYVGFTGTQRWFPALTWLVNCF